MDMPAEQKHGDRPQKKSTRMSKGERTKQRIRLGFVTALNERSFTNVTIEDICHHAETTVGGFYFHYQNQQSLLDEVIAGFVDELATSMEAAVRLEDLAGSITRIVHVFAQAYSKDPGLTRCCQQLVRTQTTAARIWRDKISNCEAALGDLLRANDPALSTEKASFVSASIISLATVAFTPDHSRKYTGGGLHPADHFAETVVAICLRLAKVGESR